MREAGRGISSRHALAAAGLVLLMAVALFLMGRLPWCACGAIRLWHGDVASPENSQHLSDWYTLSHVVHGFLFYYLTRLLLPGSSLGRRLVAATFVEVAWEIVENSPPVIERYRAATIALGYTGDSIVNSASDVAAMIVGFLLAARLPGLAVAALAVAMEVAALVAIRDNLTLNVLMLLFPLESVRDWQMGG